MIEKTAEYIQTPDDQEIFSILPEPSKTEGLVKTAEYASEISNFLDALKREPGFVYALANALTAGEFYGPNRNGDYFPEEALKKYHKTFEEHGHVYKHHVNKDPEKSMGKVIYSFYNPHMRRVETVIKLKEAHPDVCKLMDNMQKGMSIKLSMGCKVPYDVCSITGKKARTRKDYSDYLRNKMNQILDDGRRVYAINTKPRFFDLSIVTIPADPLAAIMAPIGFGKMAEKTNTDKTSKIEAEQELVMEKAASAKLADDKQAAIEKEIASGEIEHIEQDPKRIIVDSQKNLTQEQIEKLSEYPLNETLSTFCALRILPKREDFQKLALYTTGNRKLANLFESEGRVFECSPNDAVDIEGIGPEYANEKIANEIKESILDFSLTKPAIINRIIEKTANIKNMGAELYPNRREVEQSFINNLLFDDEPRPAKSGVKDAIPLMTSVGTLYAGYAKIFGETASASNFTKFISKNPWVAPLVGLGIGVAIDKQQNEVLDPVNEEIFNKRASAAPIEKTLGTFLLAAPTSYYFAAKNEAKARQGQPLSDAEDFVRRNPLLTAVGATGFVRSLSKSIGHSINDAASSVKAKAKTQKKSGIGSYFNFRKHASGIDNLNPETINIIYKELIS